MCHQQASRPSRCCRKCPSQMRERLWQSSSPTRLSEIAILDGVDFGLHFVQQGESRVGDPSHRQAPIFCRTVPLHEALLLQSVHQRVTSGAFSTMRRTISVRENPRGCASRRMRRTLYWLKVMPKVSQVTSSLSRRYPAATSRLSHGLHCGTGGIRWMGFLNSSLMVMRSLDSEGAKL